MPKCKFQHQILSLRLRFTVRALQSGERRGFELQSGKFGSGFSDLIILTSLNKGKGETVPVAVSEVKLRAEDVEDDLG